MRRDASVGVDLYGRDVSASKALKTLGNVAENTGKRIDHVANRIVKGMALAATAAAAAAVKIGVDSVKAAAEDAKSVTLLEKAIHNSTKATAAQTKAVEDYINKAQLRYNFEDTVLRSGMGRLVAATHSVTKSQKLLMFSMDLSAKSGKDLDTVTMAVSKAYAGNLGALSRMGVAIPKTLLKTKDFGKVIAYVETQVKGFAATAADTFEGRLGRARLAINEAKESLGYMLLPIVERFAKYIAEKAVPALQAFIDQNGPKLKAALQDSLPTLKGMFDKVVGLGKWMLENKDTVVAFGKALLAALAAEKVAAAVASIVKTLNTLRTAYLALAAGEALATGGANIYAGLAAIAAAGLAYTVADAALGGPLTAASRAGGGKGQSLAGTNIGSVSGQFAYGTYAAAAAGPTYNITVNGSLMTEDQTLRRLRSALAQLNRRQASGTSQYGL